MHRTVVIFVVAVPSMFLFFVIIVGHENDKTFAISKWIVTYVINVLFEIPLLFPASQDYRKSSCGYVRLYVNSYNEMDIWLFLSIFINIIELDIFCWNIKRIFPILRTHHKFHVFFLFRFSFGILLVSTKSLKICKQNHYTISYNSFHLKALISLGLGIHAPNQTMNSLCGQRLEEEWLKPQIMQWVLSVAPEKMFARGNWSVTQLNFLFVATKILFGKP